MALCSENQLVREFSENQIFNIRKLNNISNVSIANMTVSKVIVVIKKIKNPQMDKVNKWKHIYNHPNIVGFLGIYSKDENQLFLVMPYAAHGDLRLYLKNNQLSFNRKIEVAIDIVNGIKFLHNNNIVHENINPRNILIFDGVAKISNLPDDLYSRNKDLYFADNLFDNVGYIDPSSILNRNYKKNKSVDIYSLGTLLWEIMSEKIPYSDYQNNGILQLIIKIKGGQRETDDVTSNLDYIELYKSCWNGNNLARPTIDEVYDQLLSIMKLGLNLSKI